MSILEANVVGAGPAGLTAAITLAQAGWRVSVFHRDPVVGRRFHGDFQGLENWSVEEDVVEMFQRMGLQVPGFFRPFREAVFYGPNQERAEVNFPRPLFYVVKRGPVEDSLEQALFDARRWIWES